MAVAGAAGIVTVPAGHRWVVKDLEAYHSGGAAGIAFWRFRGIYLMKCEASADQTFSFPERQVVLHPGEELAFYISSGTWFFHAAGYELTE